MNKKLNLAMDIGEEMLLSGAEVHRVEDSVGRILHAFGAERFDCFIITSSIVVTMRAANGELFTETRRITSSGTDFTKLDRLNRLSRRICSEQLTDEQIEKELANIRQTRPYPFAAEVLIYALIAGSFTAFFGGDLMQTAVSAVIGSLLRFLVWFSEKTVSNTIFSKFVCSSAVTFLTFLSVFSGIVSQGDEIIIGNIMLLIPGLGLTNALRDLFTGDSLAGTLRTLEAMLCALGIAGGYLVVSFAIGGAV